MKFSNLTYTMAFWLLRFWLAARAIGTGLTKFQGTKEVVKDAGGLSADDVDILQDMASNAAGGPPSKRSPKPFRLSASSSTTVCRRKVR